MLGLLDRLVHVEDGYRRNSHDFGDDIIGDVDTARLLSARLYVFDVKRRPDKPSIAQGDLGYAVPNTGDLDRRWRSDLE